MVRGQTTRHHGTRTERRLTEPDRSEFELRGLAIWPALSFVKILHLLRHAKSSWKDSTLADADRPLAPRGRRAAQAIAEHCRRERVAPDLVLCSSSQRTRETLDLVAPGLPADVAVVVDDGLYAADADDLLQRLKDLSDRVSSVMLIGHNPAIQELTLTLAGRGSLLEPVRAKFPTGALATLAIDAQRWEELRAGDAELLAFVTPA
jgi:phosphohistidine phosphatase